MFLSHTLILFFLCIAHAVYEGVNIKREYQLKQLQTYYCIPLSSLDFSLMDGRLTFIVITLLCFGLNNASMSWTVLDDNRAVCNDYSRAGFFVEETNTKKWVIFLESGGLCYSAESCNRRFIKSQVRLDYASNEDEAFYELNPDFDLNKTWEDLVSRNTSLSQRISPYMTSISTYIEDNEQFAEIDGKDFLDDSEQLNPMFYDFNKVVIPYCSSDVWLAEDDFVPPGVNLTSTDPQKQFLETIYEPESEMLQFTFRGRTILKAVIKQLLKSYDLSSASEILLAGSSAGGLGVVNNAQWIISKLENNTVNANISILVDSSWFINFRGNIYRRFDGMEQESSSGVSGTDKRLFDLIGSIPQCVTTTPTGSPCCISLDCVLSDERYFPVGEIPVMIVFSLYDVFLLGDAIAQEIPPGESEGSQPSVGAQFVLTVAEYGGAMNTSIGETVPRIDGVSYVATQCLQHIYFATSTLWGPHNLLGDSSSEQLNVSLGAFTGSFR